MLAVVGLNLILECVYIEIMNTKYRLKKRQANRTLTSAITRSLILRPGMVEARVTATTTEAMSTLAGNTNKLAAATAADQQQQQQQQQQPESSSQRAAVTEQQ